MSTEEKLRAIILKLSKRLREERVQREIAERIAKEFIAGAITK